MTDLLTAATDATHHQDPGEIRRIELSVSGAQIEVIDDPYSDRLRCDHPSVHDVEALGEALLDAAECLGRGRIVTLVNSEAIGDLEDLGFEVEAIMPGFYQGSDDCAVLGASSQNRMEPGDRTASRRTEEILAAKRGKPGLHVAVASEQATAEDAEEIAELLDVTFAEYPTPTGDADYIEQQLDDGNIFRVIRRGAQIVACASADIVAEARTAELTDCATQPAHRGNGYMRTILDHLMTDLRQMNFPTAFTLARAAVPGVNVAFQRCGFRYRGQMVQSCRIGTGLEDMNVWSRRL